ncbi:MAG: ABC transporter substrate-binding protein [Patescibacteria group bacterium]|nr:ABC transporter substrate-binding protein [Patescibacteria group bacterium]
MVVKLGYNPLPHVAFVAKEMGYFDEAGLDVQLEKFSNTNLVMEALSRGDIDVAAAVSYSTLLAFENRSPGIFKLYEGWTENQDTGWSQLIVKKDSGITSPEQLVGKKVVMRSGLSSKAQGELVLSALGLDPKKIEFVQVDPPLLVLTFAKPEISAYLDIQPAATDIVEKGLGTTLIISPRAKYVINPFPVAAAALSVRFIEQHPREAQKFVQSIEKAIGYIEKNEQKTREIFQKYLGLDSAVAQNMPLPKYGNSKNINLDNVNRLADIEIKYKILDKKPIVSDWLYRY